MKKLLIITALILFAGIAFGQTLQKGNLIGVHSLTITLQPDVTMDQYMDFFTNKFIPKYQESFPGLKLQILKGDRGENENKLGLLFSFESVEARDKLWPTMDGPSELAQQGFAKLNPTWDELVKLGTWTSVHTDWVVQ
jgi:hypothetical protein